MPDEDDLRVAPVRPWDGRRAGSLRVAAVLVLGAAFVGVAVAKPWDAASRGRSVPAPGASGAAVALGPGRTATPAAPAASITLPSEAAIRKAMGPRPDWGIRAYTPAGGTRLADPETPLEESWVAVAPLPAAELPVVAGAAPPGTPFLPIEGRLPVALGLTGPDEDIALDIRVWRLRQDGGFPERIAPRAIAGQPGRPIWTARDAAGGDAPHWSPGTYRVDLLTGEGIERFLFRVPGEAPDPARALTPVPDDAVLEATIATRLAERADAATDPPPEGIHAAFAIVGDSLRPLAAANEAAPEEVVAWLAPRRLPARVAWRPRSQVVAPQADALGWLVPRGSPVVGATLRLIAPVERAIDVDVRRVVLDPAVFPAGDAVLVRTRDGGALPPGVYRLEVRWRVPGGPVREAAWHLDLVSARDLEADGSLVRFTRVWLATESTAAATPDPTASPERDVARDRLTVLDDGDAMDGNAMARPAAACERREPHDPGGAAVGLLGLGGSEVLGIHVSRLFEGARRVVADTGLVRRAAPDMAVVAAPSEGWQPGAYRIFLTFTGPDAGGRRSATYLVCFGTGSGDGLVFDPATTRLAVG